MFTGTITTSFWVQNGYSTLYYNIFTHVGDPFHTPMALDTIVIEVTETKRDFLEHTWIDLENPDLTASERRVHDRSIAQTCKKMPGKLDHATVAAYCVGRMFNESQARRKGHSPTHSYVMNTVLQAGAGSAQASKRAESFSTGGSVFYSKQSFVSPPPPPPPHPPSSAPLEAIDE